MTEFVTHDTKRFVVSKPDGFECTPGQGVEILIDKPDWRNEEGRPFTPTSAPDALVLEFTIKRYPEHKGVTAMLHTLAPGDELLMTAPFGTIDYKGKGVFLAAGAGITPFLAIFRDLAVKGEIPGNSLLYSNKRPADIICEKELRYYFDDHLVLTCTREPASGIETRRIDKDFISEQVSDFRQYFYVCGPDEFVNNMNETLQGLGAKPELLVFEE